MNLSVRRALAAAAATAALVALAGCGGDDSGGDNASDQTSDPAAASSATGEASEDSGDSLDSDAGRAPADGQELSGAEFADILSTAIDQATTAHVTMELGATASGEGDADYTKAPAEMAMKLTMDALGGDAEVRLVGGTMYMKAPSFGDQWISIPLDDPNSPLGALGSQLDMTKQLETFAAAVSSATYHGEEDVDGESLGHYTATVDTKKLLEQMPSEAAGQGQLPDTMTQEWWFDGDGLIRKFSSDFGGQTVVMTMSDWGEDVSIEAPPSDEVTTMPGTTS